MPTVKPLKVGQKLLDPSKPLPRTKHEMFAHALVKNKGNQTKAYQEIYQVEENVAKAAGSELMTKINVNQRVQHLLNHSSDLNLGTITKSLTEQTQAQRPLVVSKDAQVIYVPDHQAQLEAKKTVLRLHGLLKNTMEINVDKRQAHIHIEEGQAKHLSDLSTKLLEINHRLGLSTDVTNEPDGEVRAPTQEDLT